MNGLLSNPELVRHLRMEMRPRRMLIAAAVVGLLCLLALWGFYQGSEQERAGGDFSYLHGLYVTYLIGQSALLCLWCLSAASQAIAGERTNRTYDFLRTTRLTASELLFGMVAGTPVMAYFAIACSLPFSIAVGLAAGYSPIAILVTYAMLALISVVISLAGLNISMLTDRPRAGELLLLVFFLLGPWTMLAFVERGSPLPGLSSITVIPGLLQLYGPDFAPRGFPARVPFFAVEVPNIVVSFVIYGSLAMWLAVALARNLKKDIEEIRLLSHWQSIGFAAYLNILALAMLDLRGPAATETISDIAKGVSTGYLIFNWVVLYGIGITLLTPAESLKTWWRRSESGIERYWSEDGPPWLWMIACAAVVLGLFTVQIVASSGTVPLSTWSLGMFAARLGVVLVHCIRDVLFLQWCMLTRMKSPVTKGILFLMLYYSTVSIVIAVTFGSQREQLMGPAFALFTPSGALAGDYWPSTLIGLGIQVVVSIVLLLSIERRIAAKPLTVTAM